MSKTYPLNGHRMRALPNPRLQRLGAHERPHGRGMGEADEECAAAEPPSR